MSRITASFPKAGAKVRLITGSANLSRLFLEGSAKILCKSLIYKYVIKQDFYERERRKGKGTHYNISGGRALRARITITYRVGKGRAEPGNREQKEGEQSADKGKTVLKGGENDGLERKKVSPIEEYLFLFSTLESFSYNWKKKWRIGIVANYYWMKKSASLVSEQKKN